MWDNESWKPSTDQLVIPRPFRGSRANIANICPQYACGPGWSTFQNELNKNFRGPHCHVWIHLEPHNHQVISSIKTCVIMFTQLIWSYIFQVKRVKKNGKTSWKADPRCHIHQLNRRALAAKELPAGFFVAAARASQPSVASLFLRSSNEVLTWVPASINPELAIAWLCWTTFMHLANQTMPIFLPDKCLPAGRKLVDQPGPNCRES